MAQYKGKVAWFNNAKGYGFITAEGIKDVFCHFSAVQQKGYKALNEGDEVEFDIGQGEKGAQAENVLVIGNRVTEPLPIHRSYDHRAHAFAVRKVAT